MALTRPPLSLIQPVGILDKGNKVETDGRNLYVSEDTIQTEDLRITSGSFNQTNGVLSLVCESGRVITISGFLTATSMGKGERGERGPAGVDGIRGTDGVNGLQGLRGLTGAQGLSGEKGDKGEDGPTGSRGEKGDTGEDGQDSLGVPSTEAGAGSTGTINHHVHQVKDIDALGIMSDKSYLRGDGWWSEITQQPPVEHVHSLEDITATGTLDNTTYLRGDGVWATLPPVTVADHHHNLNDIDIPGTASSETYLRGDKQWAALNSIPVVPHQHDVSNLNATGSRSTSTFLRGDGTWASVPTGGLVPHQHSLTDLNAVGVRSDTSFLRGDGVWAVPSVSSHHHGIGDLDISGTKSGSTYISGSGDWKDPLLEVSTKPVVASLDGASVIPIVVTDNNSPVVKKVTVDQLYAFNKSGKMKTLNNATGNITLDTDNYDIFNIALAGNVSILVDESKLSTPPYQFVLRLKQAGSGNYSVAWGSAFKFPNGIAPGIGKNVDDVEIFLLEVYEVHRVEVSKADGPYK